MNKIRSSENRHVCAVPGMNSVCLKILLAEDNPMNARVAASFLTRMGHIIFTAVDGNEVLSILSGESFDLVLMDVEMPEMDGLETTRRIRAGEAGSGNSRLPIIAMTAHALSEFREKCEKAGMNDFVTKPVDFYDLGNIIQKNISSTVTGLKPVKNSTAMTGKKDLLRRLGGDINLLYSIYDIFIGETPKDLKKIKNALSCNNMNDVCLHAHSLKGSCGTIGAESCRYASEQLEMAARKRMNPEYIGRLFEKLKSEINKLLTIIIEEHADSNDCVKSLDTGKLYFTDDDIKALSLEKLKNLKSYSEIGDATAVKNIIDEIRSYNPNLADLLSGMCDNFRFDKISEFLKNRTNIEDYIEL